MRKTHALVQVASVLLDMASEKHWGYELARRSGVRSGVLYPMLTRMVDAEWLVDGWENPSELKVRRPPRRYYELTEHGKQELAVVMEEARADTRIAQLMS